MMNENEESAELVKTSAARRSSSKAMPPPDKRMNVSSRSFSLAKMKGIDDLDHEFSKLLNLDKLTSSVVTTENPPKDWADVSFLVPHEAIRREMTAMCKSIDKINEGGCALWQTVYFCEWFSDSFFHFIEEHHDNEELLYFPWVATKAELPEKKLSKGHKDLMESMNSIRALCEKVIEKGGANANEELEIMKDKMHEVTAFMFDHLKEEEMDIPPLLRANFTKEEEEKIIEKISQRGGLVGLRIVFPSISLAMQEWTKPAFYDDFMSTIPPPVRYLLLNYFAPDYENCIIPKRDAPFLSEKPRLKRVGCCKICCFPCII